MINSTAPRFQESEAQKKVHSGAGNYKQESYQWLSGVTLRFSSHFQEMLIAK